MIVFLQQNDFTQSHASKRGTELMNATLTMFSPAILAAVALGGATGAVLRYMVSSWSIARFGEGFPWGTLTVNLIGSFLIGVAVALLSSRLLEGDVWRPLIVVGLLGSLTTFSTFSLEMLGFLQRGQLFTAAGYLLASVLGCVLLTYCGFTIARH